MPLTTAEFRRCIDALPRVRVAHLPTPLEPLPRLSEALGGPQIYIKRDDCTGLSMGGNKTRHNEFLLADALQEEAEMLVWGAGVQSNNCRQTAASCAKLGLECHLVLSRASHGDQIQGNLLLDHLLGASYEIVDAPVGPELDAIIAETAERFRSQGRRVYNWDRDKVKARAAVSYSLCMAELADQLSGHNLEPTAVFICSGGSTGAGMALGKRALGLPFDVHSILPIRWPWNEREDLAKIATKAARLLDLPIEIEAEEISIDADFVGPGYGIPTKECMEAITLMARSEGILLDPSYTGKAMAGLIQAIRSGRFSQDQSVVFVHTGGTPALFAYRDELVEMITPFLPRSSA